MGGDSEAPGDVRELARERARAREAKDFDLADRLRDRIAASGWSVIDSPGGWTLEPAQREEPVQVRAADVPSALDLPETADVSVHWVCEGWPGDISRSLEAFRRFAGSRRVRFVVADVTGEVPDRWGEEVEVVRLEGGTGWAAACNAGLRRAQAGVVVLADGSIEPAGDVLGPLLEALKSEDVGVCGPFGVRTEDMREFRDAEGPGPCDAIEGYLMAFRRDVLAKVGGFDEKFRWYRTADIEWCFRVKDAGYRCEVVDVPVLRHEHRMWSATSPEDRDRWSKRNYYRFLDRWRDRWDLVLSGEPEHVHDHHHHEH